MRPIYVFFRTDPLYDFFDKNDRHETILMPSTPRLSNPISCLRAIAFIRSVVRANHAAFVHSSMAYAALFGAWSALFSACRHVWFQHGPVSGWMDVLAGFSPARAVFFNSKSTMRKQLMCEWGVGWPGRQRRLVRLGVELAEVETDQDEIDLGNPPVIAMFCRIDPIKGIELFMDAIAQLHGEGIHCVALVYGGARTADSRTDYENRLHEHAKVKGGAGENSPRGRRRSG